MMKTFRKELWFLLPTRRGFVNITGQVQQCINESQIREGLVLVNSMHITSSVFINDDEATLDQPFSLPNDATVTFIRLTFLAGRRF